MIEPPNPVYNQGLPSSVSRSIFLLIIGAAAAATIATINSTIIISIKENPFEIENNNKSWKIERNGSASVRAYYPEAQVEIMVNLGTLLPTAPLCVSNERIKDIKFNINIFKVAMRGDSDWAKSFEKTRIQFSRPGESEERRVYGSTLVKNNAEFSEGAVVNIGTLEFLAPFTCEKLDGTRLRIINMRTSSGSLPTLDFTVKLVK